MLAGDIQSRRGICDYGEWCVFSAVSTREPTRNRCNDASAGFNGGGCGRWNNAAKRLEEQRKTSSLNCCRLVELGEGVGMEVQG